MPSEARGAVGGRTIYKGKKSCTTFLYLLLKTVEKREDEKMTKIPLNFEKILCIMKSQ